MNDLISRQDAIDAVMKYGKQIPTFVIAVKDALENLPSAEPEIIRCKDCKEFRRWIDTDFTFCDCTEYEVKEDDFCSRAERREDG